ncbi:MAG TPA: hypothetical protein VHV51_18915 [Polyangiaceae bacterium]|nr:hypothetical protein [Polyangiaceae bacterium]
MICSRSLQHALGCALGAATLLVSSGAFAQTFGEKGQLAISAERLFGYAHSSQTTSAAGGDVTYKYESFALLSSPIATGPNELIYNPPRIAGDYFVIDNLSVGAALGYSNMSVTVPTTGNVLQQGPSGDSWLFAPRVGYSLLFSDIVGFWPRGGFTYRSFSGNDNTGGHVFALTLEAPFTFMLIPHVVFTAGPTLDLGLGGSVDVGNINGATVSEDFSTTEIGVQTALIATVW